MSSTDIFWAIGDAAQWALSFFQNDFPLTGMMNLGVLLLGFVGLFIWLSKQIKYNEAAASNPDQLK
ncbi:MAG: hypothetical protein MK066_02215 [Crocinitomicaceae bacterium]|nr:hypothetical protein [Crocinitomicaceae bacterium]